MTHKLPIKGGSPTAEVLIKGEDIHAKRSGLNYIIKAITYKVYLQIIVNVKPLNKFTEETKSHIDLMPSTCLIQKRHLYFVSGFRNYIGDKLLRDLSYSTLKHPEGDAVIAAFPKILDCPDICEVLVRVWAEDV